MTKVVVSVMMFLKNWRWLYFTLIVFGISYIYKSPAVAQTAFPGSLWESSLIKDQVLSLAIGDLNHDAATDIVWAGPKAMVAQTFYGGAGLSELARLKVSPKTKIIRVDIGDWDRDGKVEILVAVVVRQKLFSRLYHLSDSKFKKIHEFDELVVALKDGFSSSLFSQRSARYGLWAGVAQKLEWRDNKWVKTDPLVINKGIGPNELSLLSVTKQKKRYVVMTKDHKLLVQDATGLKKWKSGIGYGGVVGTIEYQIKDPLGLQKDSRFFIPTRMVARDNDFYVIKNDDYLKSVVGAAPNIKSSQWVKLKWDSNSGLQEQFNSPRYNGAITDLRVLDFDGDGLNDVMISLIQSSGFFDKYGKLSSRLIVLRGN